MDIKTQVLTKLISQIVDNLFNHQNWDPMMSYTDWGVINFEIPHEDITSKIQKLLQSKEYMDLIHYGNQFYDEAVAQEAQEFGESLDQFSEDLKKNSTAFLP